MLTIGTTFAGYAILKRPSPGGITDIKRIILKYLEKDVNWRYPSIALVVRDLQQL